MTSAPHLDTALEEALANVIHALPPLPTQLRYHDTFADKARTLRDFSNSSIVEFRLDGQVFTFDLREFGSAEIVVKHTLVDWLSRSKPNTVVLRLHQLRGFIRSLGFHSFRQLIVAPPWDAGTYWNTYVLPRATPIQATSVRAFLHSLCNLSIGGWDVGLADLVRSFRSPTSDRFRVVRNGDCFLSVSQQAQIIAYIDEFCSSLSVSTDSVTSAALRNVCVLVVSFQYALRPGQIARIEHADVRIFSTGAVHIGVTVAKQRDIKKMTRETRRIKREWSPLFIELHRRREAGTFPLEANVPNRLFFGLKPKDVTAVIKRLTKQITGEPWTPTENRHTSAQRLADAGVAHVAVSEFMMHSSTKSANVYFDTSPTQAQRVNEAMAISPIYANVAKVAKTKTINIDTLFALSPDQQIGGVPHGVPVSGIGGCDVGQSLCSKNPVLSCYTCSKFLPLGEIDVHERVLEQFRPIIVEFASASRDNRISPAFVQLKATLDGVRRVIQSLSTSPDPSDDAGEDN